MTTQDKLTPLEDILDIRVATHNNSYQQALELEDERQRSEAIARYGAKICESSRIRDLVKPYDARRLALEKVADCALAVVQLPLAMREALDELRRALAAVPEIPEDQ